MSTDAEAAVPALTIAGVALASALVPLNSTMIAVALPSIARDFDITTSQASVLVTVYLVAMLAGQPIAGRLVDAVGAHRLAVVAVAGFGVFSAGAMFAGTFAVLVLLRTLQAVFASALSPSVQAMLREITRPSDRGRAFGLQGSVIGVGAGLGPVIGGVLTATFGWQAIFGANLPVVVVVLVVLRRAVPPSTARTVVGAATGASVTAGPLLNRVFVAAFSAQALSTLAQYALVLVSPIVLDRRGWGAGAIGVALSALTLGMVVMSPLGGRLGDRFGRRLPVVVGLSVALVAVFVAALAGDAVVSALLIVTLLVFGLGLGTATPSIMTAGIEAAPEGRVGLAAGMLSTSRYVGSITATLVLADVVGDDASGVAVMLAVCTVALAASVVAAFGLPTAPGAAERVSGARARWATRHPVR